jgi:hypothetical protein
MGPGPSGSVAVGNRQITVYGKNYFTPPWQKSMESAKSFYRMSRDCKSNSPCKFGKKIIVSRLVKYDQWYIPVDGPVKDAYPGPSGQMPDRLTIS